MAGRECYHCKQWVEEGEAHDCWTTTEAALTSDLAADLQDAYARIREEAVEFGEQRIYASGSCIMFSRTSCYFFVRPRMTRLELCIFLGRAVKDPRVRRAMASSRQKTANMVHITHRDEIEAPITDWLQEAYEMSPVLSTPQGRGPTRKGTAAKPLAPKSKKRTSRQKRKPRR